MKEPPPLPAGPPPMKMRDSDLAGGDAAHPPVCIDVIFCPDYKVKKYKIEMALDV